MGEGRMGRQSAAQKAGGDACCIALTFEIGQNCRDTLKISSARSHKALDNRGLCDWRRHVFGTLAKMFCRAKVSGLCRKSIEINDLCRRNRDRKFFAGEKPGQHGAQRKGRKIGATKSHRSGSLLARIRLAESSLCFRLKAGLRTPGSSALGRLATLARRPILR